VTKNEQRVGKLVKKWRDILGINQRWEFIVKVVESEECAPKKERLTAAWIINDGAYLRSAMTFNLFHPECKQDLESVVCHELIHCLMNEVDAVLADAIGEKFETVYKEITERLTTNLEMAFAKVRKSK
jgi:hypothetical protein